MKKCNLKKRSGLSLKPHVSQKKFLEEDEKRLRKIRTKTDLSFLQGRCEKELDVNRK